MKISFNIQYNAPVKVEPRNDFERSFEQAVKTRKELALLATGAALKDLTPGSQIDLAQVRSSVKGSLEKAGLQEAQIQKVLTFVPFAIASNLSQWKA